MNCERCEQEITGQGFGLDGLHCRECDELGMYNQLTHYHAEIDEFIEDTAAIIGYEIENVTFKRYEGGRWYFEGFTEYEGEKEFYSLRAEICTVGVNLEYQNNGSWFNYGLAIVEDYVHLARTQKGAK